jgi:DNA-binding transcriptional regulator GbsR (MarR family)
MVMPRTLDKQELEQQALALLAAAPAGLSSPALQQAMKISQPTVSRLLMNLQARGLVAATGSARASRYHAVQGKPDVAALRSRMLHEKIARKLIRQPERLEQARKRLRQLKSVNPAGKPYHQRWEALLQEPLPKLLRKMTEDSEEAATLRKESPFTILLTADERKSIFGKIHSRRTR